MGINFAAVKVQVRKVLDDLFTDQALIRPVTYRRFLSQTFDKALKRNVIAYQDTPLNLIRLTNNQKSAELFTGNKVQVGEVVYIMRASDDPGSKSLKDLITDADQTSIKIKGLKNIFDLAWAISTEAT